MAWVTGGGSGIGEAGAEALAADGWTVVVSGRRKDALDAVVAKIGKNGGKAEAIALDVSKKADVQQGRRSDPGKTRPHRSLGQQCRHQRSQAQLGRHGTGRLGQTGRDQSQRRAVLHARGAAGDAKQKDGCIINVASWAGRHVSKMPGPAYTTTKHAVLALTHSFNMDECVNGLRACCLSPGEVATPILKLRPLGAVAKKSRRKMLQPEDLGRTIAFVASMPPRVCINEILISPTHNRGFIQMPANREPRRRKRREVHADASCDRMRFPFATAGEDRLRRGSSAVRVPGIASVCT